ncbi:MAG: amidase domain-containing protein, partial [Paraclostridium sp.]
FRIGTYHYLNMRIVDNEYVITKEWYTDPFADSLHLDNIKSDDIRNYILSKENQPISLTNEQTKAMEYAHKYCGAAADEEHGMKFNPKYKDFNPDGGDCANFASQIMYESKRFKKNRIWNYEGNSGTKAWVNAQGFKNYLLNSGRGSLISKGSYEDVYKTAYNMRPGDIVAYEKGGRITHVSTVTGLDSRGYPLVTCHNTDRLLVPWDLGWSDKSIRFHLIKVHY